MAKQMTRHARRMLQLQQGRVTVQDAAKEGKWEIKFVFDGYLYTKTHQFSTQELKHMKDLCREFGDIASQQVIWRAAFKGVSLVSEELIARAGLDYVKQHYKGPTGPAANETSTEQASYETLAALEAYVESKKPLPDEKAFDLEEKQKIEDQTMQEKL